MNKDVKPDWYKHLADGPHRDKTFTADKMTRIERKLTGRQQKEKRRNWLSIAAISATAIVLLIGVTLNLDRLTGVNGPTPGEEIGGPNINDPSVPPPGTEDPPAPEDPPVNDPEMPIEPLDEETVVVLDAIEQEMLSEALPFSLGDVEQASIRRSDGQEVAVPEDTLGNLLEFLGQVFLTESQLSEEQAGNAPARDTMLRLRVGDTLYAIPYASQANVMDLGAALVYADGHTARTLYTLLQPDSAIGRFVQAYNAVLRDEEVDVEDRSLSYEPERLHIDGKSYNGWFEALAEKSPDVDLPYFTQTQRASSVRSYEQGAIISWDLLVAFTTDAYQTADGVRVGMTKDEVLQALGQPHAQTALRWKYDLDLWDDLDLYFEGDTVKYMVLTTSD